MPRSLSETWSQADLDALVDKREIERKKWAVIAAEMGRPLGTCFHRYNEIAKARAPSIVAEMPRIPLLHEELGIETQVYRVPVLNDTRAGRRFDEISNSWNWQHNYRESVTLVRVP